MALPWENRVPAKGIFSVSYFAQQAADKADTPDKNSFKVLI